MSSSNQDTYNNRIAFLDWIVDRTDGYNQNIVFSFDQTFVCAKKVFSQRIKGNKFSSPQVWCTFM
jgi:hypothetical protein